jgi:HEAT repeat protein
MRKIVLAALCAGLLGGCGQKARPVGGKPVSHWEAALRDPDVRVRKRAVLKLGNLGSPEAWPAVLGALHDADASVRSEAVQSVLKFGALAVDAVPDLEGMRQYDSDPRVRIHAGQALARVERQYAKN